MTSVNTEIHGKDGSTVHRTFVELAFALARPFLAVGRLPCPTDENIASGGNEADRYVCVN